MQHPGEDVGVGHGTSVARNSSTDTPTASLRLVSPRADAGGVPPIPAVLAVCQLVRLGLPSVARGR
jgi:hypothetical protein